MSTVSLDEKRKEKIERCEWCGEPAHIMPLCCPRILKIKYGEDGETTIYFTEAPIILKFQGDAKLSPS